MVAFNSKFSWADLSRSRAESVTPGASLSLCVHRSSVRLDGSSATTSPTAGSGDPLAATLVSTRGTLACCAPGKSSSYSRSVSAAAVCSAEASMHTDLSVSTASPSTSWVSANSRCCGAGDSCTSVELRDGSPAPAESVVASRLVGQGDDNKEGSSAAVPFSSGMFEACSCASPCLWNRPRSAPVPRTKRLALSNTRETSSTTRPSGGHLPCRCCEDVAGTCEPSCPGLPEEARRTLCRTLSTS
mmetsp:Transcript_8442/g.19975  ORF Transcript_8442/g.19975 Transcript_8442/m.19975 type:complete len:244 (-) Transcript_8442:102-833(-)